MQNVHVTIVPITKGKKRSTIAGYREKNREKVLYEGEGIFHDTYCRFLEKCNKCALVYITRSRKPEKNDHIEGGDYIDIISAYMTLYYGDFNEESTIIVY